MTQIVVPDNLHIYDTTLRDGAQQEGIRLTVADRMRIATLLDELGVTHIEGGWPGANPNDTLFFEAAKTDLHLKKATLTAFGSTRKAGISADRDPLVKALVEAGTDVVCIVAKSHDVHVRDALRTSEDENLAMVFETVTYLKAMGKEVFVDLEHFFDGYRSNPDYTLSVVRTAAEAGASVIVLCDTNGGTLPTQIADVVSAAGAVGANLGIHCHNDTGCAVANSLIAVEAGAMHIQGTINGYGERTGNANLCTLIANLQLKYGLDLLEPEQLSCLTHISHAVADIANQTVLGRSPYVGASAFAHKAGLHASAIRVNPDLYQHADPSAVGNHMRMLISDMAGRANIQIKAAQAGYELDSVQAGEVAAIVKEREAEGYSYEAADASFSLLIHDYLSGNKDDLVKIKFWRVHTEEYRDDLGDSEAVVKVELDGKVHKEFGIGNGPLNALDQALRKALSEKYPQLSQFRLTDYRVRVIDRGTDGVVRTFIDMSDSHQTWVTVGVGTNVVEASWEALREGYRYGLVKGIALS